MRENLDTEKTLIAEMTDIIRRAVALGHKSGSESATARILAAASREATKSEETVVPVPATTAAPKVRRRLRRLKRKKYPYGYVAKNTRKALSQHTFGVTFADLVDAIQALAPDIDRVAVRNSMKLLMRGNEATLINGLYFPISSEAVDGDLLTRNPSTAS